MKGLFILLLTTYTASGLPQYNYNQAGGFATPGSSFGGIRPGIGSTGFNRGFGNSDGHRGFGSSSNPAYSQPQQEAIVTKQFFIHSAPEEQDEIGGDKVINLGPARKNYRVVFIKAPHQGGPAGKVRFVAPANEEKTVIYVLSKKTDLADIAVEAQPTQSVPSKPEVRFIKYKTDDEAAHAQRTIQAQYDSIQGTSEVSDEGVAPTSSVIGALGNSGGINGGDGGFAPSQNGGSFGSFGPGNGGFSGAGYRPGLIGSSSNVNNNFATAGRTSYLPPNH